MRGLNTRRSLSLLGIAAYALSTWFLVLHGLHATATGIGLQLILLLPALLFGLRSRGNGPGAFTLTGRRTGLTVAVFLIAAALLSWRMKEGFLIPDEHSYRFQGLTLAGGKLIAPAPPGAPDAPVGRVGTPRALYFEHQIISHAGWFSKYPIGWPAVLAIPERMGLGWLVNPVLGALLLLIIGSIAEEAFGATAVFPAVAMAVLSPFYLANCVGRMSHALCGLLVGSATLCCIRGLKTGRLSRFIWMCLFLVASFQVRPFTALIVSVVLVVGSVLGTKDRPAVCVRVALFAIAAATFSLVSVGVYDFLFTGDPLRSPYALVQGSSTRLPLEIAVGGPILANFAAWWRWSMQSTIFWAFPLLPVFVVYYFWAARPRSPIPWILLALSLALTVYPAASGSNIGQRYWFEGYFGVAVVGAEGLARILRTYRCGRGTIVTIAAGLGIAQLAIILLAADLLLQTNLPSRTMERAAKTYQGCDCVVYLEDTPPDLFGMHVNPNTPNWKSARVFYAVDPGPGERARWAGILGYSHWIALRYDARRRIAEVETAAGHVTSDTAGRLE